MYKYTIKSKGIFDRAFTGFADTKEQIEQATGIEIGAGTWFAIERGKKGIVEDESFIVTIEKVK